ncbi:MAG: hypothetical protein V7629_06655 [Motiliproteus sp.]
MDPLWLLIALVLGFTAHQLRLQPLVGFLAAGFALHAIGRVITAKDDLHQQHHDQSQRH